MLAAALKHIHAASNIDIYVFTGPQERPPDITSGGLVTYELNCMIFEDLLERVVTNVEMIEDGSFGQVMPTARKQVVDNDHFMPGTQKGPGNVRANKAGTTGYQNINSRSPSIT